MALTDAESSGKLFVYSPLPDTETNGQSAPYIRLIEVHSNRDPADQPIRVSILRTRVEDAPPYRAVSYTWGDEADQEQIGVEHCDKYFAGDSSNRTALNGSLQVRKNCADVLRQLAHFGISRYYWLDAICIDQSNIQEKNVQVARMGETFRHADGVLACVGMHDDSTRLLAIKLGDFNQHLANKGTSTLALTNRRDSGSKSGNRFSQKHRMETTTLEDRLEKADDCIKACISWVSSIDGKELSSFLKALNDLTKRSYFWRIWTLQELWVAHRIQILCGFDELSLSNLLFWWVDSKIHRPEYQASNELILAIAQKLERVSDPDKDIAYNILGNFIGSGLGSAYETILYDRQRVLTEGSASTIEQLSFDQLLSMCENRECQDRRDTVYGTLTIVNWATLEVRMPNGTWITDEDEEMTIAPDYSRSRFELAKILMPRFRSFVTMRQICLGMLRLNPGDEEIVKALAYRCQPMQAWNWPSEAEPWDISRNTQMLANVPMEAFQMSPVYGLELEICTDEAGTYTRILDHTGQCGIASIGIRPDDWIAMSNGMTIILRQTGHYFSIVGNAEMHWSAYLLLMKKASIDVWFGVDDLVVHLVAFAMPATRGQMGKPEAAYVARLNTRFCAQVGSSFARLSFGDESETINRSSRLGSYRLRSVNSSWKHSPSEASTMADHEVVNKTE